MMNQPVKKNKKRFVHGVYKDTDLENNLGQVVLILKNIHVKILMHLLNIEVIANRGHQHLKMITRAWSLKRRSKISTPREDQGDHEGLAMLPEI